MSGLGLVLGLLSFLAAGDRLLAWGGPRLPGGAYRLGLAFAVGLVVLTVLPFWLNLAGVPLAPWVGRALGGAFLVLAGLALRRRTSEPGPDREALPVAARWALKVAVLFVLLATARTAWEPLTGWDARSLWGPYVGNLYYEQSVSGPGFTDPDRRLQHMNYPLLAPMARWHLAAWMGVLEDHASLLLFPACFVALLALVHGRLARSLEPPAPSLLVAVLAGLPVFWLARDGSVASGYAEVPLTLLSAALAASCLEWLASRDPSWLRVASLVGAGMMFTKRGGVMIVALAFALLLVLELRRGWSVARAGLACSALTVPWWIHQAALTRVTHSQPQNYAARLYEVAVENQGWAATAPDLALGALRETFFAPSSWSLLWWAVLASVAAGGHRSPARRFLGLLIVLYGVATWLYLVRGQLPVDSLGSSNWARYLMPASPWAVLYLGAGFEEETPKGN